VRGMKRPLSERGRQGRGEGDEGKRGEMVVERRVTRAGKRDAGEGFRVFYVH